MTNDRNQSAGEAMPAGDFYRSEAYSRWAKPSASP